MTNFPIANASAADTTFVAPAGRDLLVVFELQVSDQTASARDCLAYTTFNTPPLIAAVAGTPSTVDEGEQFALTATTGDSEQDPLTHTWEQISGISVGTLPAQEDASVTAPLVGADTVIEDDDDMHFIEEKDLEEDGATSSQSSDSMLDENLNSTLGSEFLSLFA